MSLQFERFEELASRSMQQGKIPGMSVAVARDGEIVYAKAFGYRNSAKTLPVTPDTIFGLASVSKSFTCLAAMTLVEKGLLQTDDPVEKYLPEFRAAGRRAPGILVRHIMSSTAGFPPLPGASYVRRHTTQGFPKADGSVEAGVKQGEDVPQLNNFDEMLSYLATEKYEMLGEPGQYFSYSNEGFCVLAAIMERLTGESYYKYVEEQVFGQVGMPRTTFSERKLADLGNFTDLFILKDDGETAAVPHWPSIRAFDPSGGIKSSVIDLVTYGQTYACGKPRIVAPETVERMYQPMYELEPGKTYGFGLGATHTASGRALVAHGGGYIGMSSQFGFIPGTGLSIGVLANLSGAPVAEIWGALASAALDGEDLSPRAPSRTPVQCTEGAKPTDSLGDHRGSHPCDPAAYEGKYESGEGDAFSVVLAEGKLSVNAGGRSILASLNEDGYLCFARKGNVVKARPYFDGSGRVWALMVGLRMIRRTQ